jgi:hypothetical protein
VNATEVPVWDTSDLGVRRGKAVRCNPVICPPSLQWCCPISLRASQPRGLLMAQRMPAVFFGHGNPMNAVLRNPFTEKGGRLQCSRCRWGDASFPHVQFPAGGN